MYSLKALFVLICLGIGRMINMFGHSLVTQFVIQPSKPPILNQLTKADVEKNKVYSEKFSKK